MNGAWHISAVESDDDLETLIAMISEIFEFPRPYADRFAEMVGRDAFRAVRSDDATEMIGGLSLLPMGQFFGGRSVPMTGVSTVAIQPHHRARGGATALMESAARELHEQGIALSVLYPATQTLYRRSGFEQAGSRWKVKLPLDRIRFKDRSLAVRPMRGEDDERIVRALYAQRARSSAGNLDRRDFNWARIKSQHGVDAAGYLIFEDDEPAGYFYLARRESKRKAYGLHLRDFAVRSEPAARRMLTFLADHESLADQVIWFGAPLDPLLQVLAEPAWKARLSIPWMLRIVDVRAALQERGYPLGVVCDAHLDVRDPLLPNNNSRFVLRVRDGRGTVEPGGDGTVTVDIRGLATIYSGFRTPVEAKRIGLASGDDEALHALAPLFAGPLPYMSDMF